MLTCTLPSTLRRIATSRHKCVKNLHEFRWRFHYFKNVILQEDNKTFLEIIVYTPTYKNVVIEKKKSFNIFEIVILGTLCEKC